MKHFFRSLEYLKPYRLRLGISIVAVVLIAVLWSGGIGMALPVMKVMISEEGLHGWAWRSVSEDRINARIVRHTLRPGKTIKGNNLAMVLHVVKVQDDGRAEKARIRENDWLVGLVEKNEAGVATNRYLRGDVLLRVLAQWKKHDRKVDLLV